MFKIPIAIVTIWHPDEFWRISQNDLSTLPALKKDRREQELLKAEIAQTKGLKTTTEIMHQRPVINFGRARNSFRRTWLDGKDICSIVSDYTIRLIDTEETGTQSRFRVEARPNWGTEPNILPDDLTLKMHDVLSQSRVSVRGFWINPFTIDTSKIPQGPFYDLGHTLNLLVGPYDEAECLRRAQIRFSKNQQQVTIHQHYPFYRDSLSTEDISILYPCNLWWAEYE